MLFRKFYSHQGGVSGVFRPERLARCLTALRAVTRFPHSPKQPARLVVSPRRSDSRVDSQASRNAPKAETLNVLEILD